MKNKYYRILSLILMITFPVTVIGFSINYHLCLHNIHNKLTESSTCCSNEEPETACHSCCDNPDKSTVLNDKTLKISKSNCCEDYSEFIKLNSSFTTSEKDKLLYPLPLEYIQDYINNTISIEINKLYLEIISKTLKKPINSVIKYIINQSRDHSSDSKPSDS